MRHSPGIGTPAIAGTGGALIFPSGCTQARRLRRNRSRRPAALSGVQWIPGWGKNSAEQWVDVYRKIRDAGKLIQIWDRDGTGGSDALDIVADAIGTARGILLIGQWFSRVMFIYRIPPAKQVCTHAKHVQRNQGPTLLKPVLALTSFCPSSTLPL